MKIIPSLTLAATLLVASCSPSKNDLAHQIKNEVSKITLSGMPDSSGVIKVKRQGYTLEVSPNGSWSIGHMPSANSFSTDRIVSEKSFDKDGDGIVDEQITLQLGKEVKLDTTDIHDDSGAQIRVLEYLKKMEVALGENEENSQLPTARWVIGAEGRFVRSPFTNDGLVDVEGMDAGVRVKCPMTGKLFIVPQR